MTAVTAPRRLDPTSVVESARAGGRPWSSDAATFLIVVNALAAALIVAGWLVARSHDTAGSQLGWLNLSLGGLALSGAANGIWLSQTRRALRYGMREVLLTGPSRRGAPGESPSGAGATFVATPAASRYHRSDCPLVAGKDVIARSAEGHERERRRPCEVCQP